MREFQYQPRPGLSMGEVPGFDASLNATQNEAIRSLHISDDSNWMVVGGEIAGIGFVRLYTTQRNEATCNWRLSKACGQCGSPLAHS